MSPLLIDLLIAALPFGFGIAITWRLIWPRWKVFGKGLAYFTLVGLLSSWIGHWSLLLALLHQGSGLAIHLWFSKRHGFTWYAVEDPERYVALSKEMVGYVDEPAELPGIEWSANVDWGEE